MIIKHTEKGKYRTQSNDLLLNKISGVPTLICITKSTKGFEKVGEQVEIEDENSR